MRKPFVRTQRRRRLCERYGHPVSRRFTYATELYSFGTWRATGGDPPPVWKVVRTVSCMRCGERLLNTVTYVNPRAYDGP